MTEKINIPQGYKNSPLGIIPKEWEVKRLGDVAEVKGGYAFDSKKMSDTVQQYQIVKMGNLYGGTLDMSRCRSYWGTLNEIEKDYLLKEGDIIITLTGTIGKRDYGNSVQIKKEKNLLLNQRNAKIVSKTIDNSFLFFVVNSERFLHQFFYSSRGGTGSQTNVGIPDIEDIRIIVPSIKEQKDISNIVNLWDTAIEKQSELVEKLKLRKRALMQQLFTGKKRLPGFSGEWKKRTYSSILTEVKRSLKWDEDELYKLISVRRRSEGLFFRESLYGRDIATKNLRPAKTGDFLISKMQIVHGASGLVTDEFDDAKISGSYISLVSKDSNILDIRYYNLWSQMPIFYHQTFVSSFGVHIEKMTFDLDTFMSFGMPLPPIDEQHAIVSLIESINKEIKLANEKLTNYQSQKRGLMQQLLTGKKRITNLE